MVMSSEQFQAAHESIYSLGTRILQYLQEIRQGRLSEGDDTKGLQSVEEDINKALHALKEQKYQVAVIAAMKAGKSTFLNAVIGADILASETAACTVCRTDVKHIPYGQVPKLLEYQEGQRRPVVIAEGEAGEIQQKFLERTREIREKGNTENTIRFEIEHPIEAISGLSSLTGFTLVDTPGPNEWESDNLKTVKLKQTALEALRICNAILFVLNYASYKDNAVSELFKDVIENRKEILLENTGKIYFILNKVDQKTEKDRDIDHVIEDLKWELANFGFPNPIIYPASARQGLLAKLIAQDKASESQIKDFKKFFSAKYASEDEEGNQIIPAPKKIASQALIDSGIPTIQETVIQTITQNAGWNLLSDVLAKLDKNTKAIEDTLNTRISGWEMEIEELKQKIEEYKIRSENAKRNVETVKNSVEQQKQILMKGFTQGISMFSECAKVNIQNEVDQIAYSRSTKSPKTQDSLIFNNVALGASIGEISETILELFPGLTGLRKIFRLSFRIGESLLNNLTKSFPEYLNSSDSTQNHHNESAEPYKLRLRNREDAEKIKRIINGFCAPHIQRLWLDTQDHLIREGTIIRGELVQKIQQDIQAISNELSAYLGESLQVELNINNIQFPQFEFEGIDAKIKEQQEAYRKKETKTKCCSDETYEVEASVDSYRNIYEVDLRETVRLIHQKIDEQVLRNEHLLERVIDKQVSADFRNAEHQIHYYIKKFQDEFDSLLRERQTREAEVAQIRKTLNLQKEKLNEYLSELTNIRASLDSWKPVQTLK
jgi:GTPase Era involved in 16S rRNA processing